MSSQPLDAPDSQDNIGHFKLPLGHEMQLRFDGFPTHIRRRVFVEYGGCEVELRCPSDDEAERMRRQFRIAQWMKDEIGAFLMRFAAERVHDRKVASENLPLVDRERFALTQLGLGPRR